MEHSVGHAGQLLGHAATIGEVILPPGKKFRGSGRDLPDCYHSVGVLLKHAFRNAVGLGLGLTLSP